MKVLDLDIAGDFIEMVAILMNIKARMLLPQKPGGDDEDYEDPRLELVERLLEYKRFKDVSYELEDLEHRKSMLYARQYYDFLPRQAELSDEEYLEKVTLFDLIMAFREAMENMPKVYYHEVRRIEVTVEQQTEFILSTLAREKVIFFKKLIHSLQQKIVIIVTFISLLELARNGTITVSQSDVFDDIRIKLKSAA